MKDSCKLQVADELFNDPDVLTLLNAIETAGLIVLLPNNVIAGALKQRIMGAADNATASLILNQAMINCLKPDKMEIFLSALETKQRWLAEQMREKYDSLVIQHEEKCKECKTSGQSQTTETGATGSSGPSGATGGVASAVSDENPDEKELRIANAVLDDEKVKEAIKKADYESLMVELPGGMITQDSKDVIYNLNSPAQAKNKLLKALRDSMMPTKINAIIKAMKVIGQPHNAQIIERVHQRICAN